MLGAARRRLRSDDFRLIQSGSTQPIDALRADIRQRPLDREVRLKLLGSEAGGSRAEQVLWFIMNEPATFLGPRGTLWPSEMGAFYAAGKALWREALARSNTALDVAESAAYFVAERDPEVGYSFLEEATGTSVWKRTERLVEYEVHLAHVFPARSAEFAGRALRDGGALLRDTPNVTELGDVAMMLKETAQLTRDASSFSAARTAVRTLERMGSEQSPATADLELVVRAIGAILANDLVEAEALLSRCREPTPSVMDLVRELLARGRSERVIEQMNVWGEDTRFAHRVGEWLEAIRAGRTPGA